MTASVTHNKVSTVPDGPDTDLVLPSDWNAEHAVTITPADIGAEVAGAVSTHAGLADPHTGYRLESADHSHASTGLQGGVVAASVITVDSATLVGTGANVQAVFEELDNGIADHLADTTDAHAVASITDAVSGKNGGMESVSAVGNTGTSKTISLTAGNVITFTVNGNCTFTMPTSLTSGVAISFTVILTDSGGPRNITFTGVKWSGGTDPTAMSAASAIDIYSFLTIDGGTTWYGFKGGTGMAT